jgi:hypothetical protein
MLVSQSGSSYVRIETRELEANGREELAPLGGHLQRNHESHLWL